MKVFNNVIGLKIDYFDIRPLKELIPYEEGNQIIQIAQLLKINGTVWNTPFITPLSEDEYNNLTAIAVEFNLKFFSNLNGLYSVVTIKEMLEAATINGMNGYEYFMTLPRLTEEEFFAMPE